MTVMTVLGVEVRPAGLGLCNVVCSRCGDLALDLTMGQTKVWVRDHAATCSADSRDSGGV